MNSHILLRCSGLAAIVSALFSLLVILFVPVGDVVPIIPEVLAGLFFVGQEMLVFVTLTGLVLDQAPRLGCLGQLGLFLAMAGTLLAMPQQLAFVGFPFFFVGLLLLALISHRAGSLPSQALWLWIIGAVPAFLGAFVNFQALFVFGLLLSAGGRAWLGAVLWAYRGEKPLAA